MNVSEFVYYDFYAIGSLIPALLLGLLGYFFMTIKNKSKASFHFGIAFIICTIFSLAYFVSAAVYHPLAAYHRWVTVATAIFQIFHFSLAIFSFPDVRFPRFRKIFIACVYLISVVLIAYFFKESYHAQKVFLFAGHYWDFDADKASKLIAMALILLIFIILLAGIARTIVNRGIERWAALFMGVTLFISFIIPGIANMLSRDGLFDRGTYQLTQNLSSMAGAFIVAIIYLNTTKDRSTFMSKILIVTVTTLLVMVQGFTYYSLQGEEKSFDTLLRSETTLAVQTNTFPSDMEYMVSYTPKDGIVSSKFKNDSKREALNLSACNQEFYNTLIYEKLRNMEKTGFQDKLKTLLSDANPLFAGYKSGILEFASSINSNEKDPFGKVLQYIDAIERPVLYTSNKIKQLPDDDFALHLKKFLPDTKAKIFNGVLLDHLEKSGLANANLKKEVLAYLTPMRKPGARIYRKDTGDKNHYVAIMQADAVGNRVFEAGYPYLNYRNYVHETSKKYIILLLIIVGAILAGFPLFFRGSLVKPIKNLLAGLKEMQQGNLKVQIPIRVEDEFGFMSHNFNTMAEKIRAATENLEDKVSARTHELKQANEIAEKARLAAEAASQAKGMFLSRMSHEIRTPMNSVIGFSDMLLDTTMSEEQVEFVRNITKSGEALLSLINEILDFSKIESGQMAFQSIDFDLEITAFDVCHLTQPRLGNKPVEVFCRVGDSLPAFIKSDPTRLRQVLLNLISNAIKFTAEGEIELCIVVEEETERQLKLHATVRDTGIGIPADKLETVFELFQQVDGSITRKFGGTGLGLAICKQIARLMKGAIWVESELGKGSTFHFTAWVDKSEKVFVKQPQAEALAGKKALLVDDYESNLDILAHVVQLAGMRSETVRRGDAVLPLLQKALAAKDPFDVCILDIQMPDMSGYEVSKQLRRQKEPLIANLKLLAFSSSVTKRIKMFKESGFDGFLPKPIHRHTLITMLKRLLGEVSEEIESQPTNEKAVVITQHTLAEEAKHSVRILLAEDDPMNQKLAQYMLTKAGYQLEVANNGRETVEKYTAEPEHFDLIFMDVHMPEMDGLEATKVLRNRGYKEIPIIALTADAMKEDRERCLEVGMNDYMAKPIKREEVFAMIKKWVFKE